MKLSSFRSPFASLLIIAAVALMPATSSACSPAKEPEPEPPDCAYPTLAAIDAAYVAEGVKVCKGKTRQTCPAMPELEAKYSAKREAWIRCH